MTATSTGDDGVQGYTGGTGKAGIRASSSDLDGLRGISSSAARAGLAGYNTGTGGAGVFGWVDGTGTGVGVFGDAGNGANNFAGYFRGKVLSFGYFTNSDARLKKDVVGLPASLDKVRALHAVSYYLKADTSMEHRQLGLIAQEVRAVFPELVDEEVDTGTLSVNYIALIPALGKTLQEQDAVIRAQDARIAALENDRPRLLGRLFDGKSGWAFSMMPVGIFASWLIRRRKFKA